VRLAWEEHRAPLEKPSTVSHPGRNVGDLQGFSGTCEGTLKYKVAYRSVLGLRGDVQNALGRLGEPKVEFFCPSF
jgi:hypothetical protein